MRTPPRVEFLKRDKWPLEGSGVGGGGDGWGREGGGIGEGVGRELGAGLAPGGCVCWPPSAAGTTEISFREYSVPDRGFRTPYMLTYPPGFKLSRGG